MIAVVLLGILALESKSSGEYSITPGDSTPVAPLIKLNGLKTNPHPGHILFTDVYLQPLSEWQLFLTHFQHHVQVVPADALTEPGVSTSELNAQGYLEMYDAKHSAEVAAFRAVGWRVPSTPSGTVVTGVEENSPASHAKLAVGDLITGLNSHPVHSACQLISLSHNTPPGTSEVLDIDKVKISSSGRFTYETPSTVRLTTAPLPSDLDLASCGVSGRAKSWVGVALEDGVHYTLPAKVSINTANIGGPSAGLAMTLALINKLSEGSLTGDHVVAATGTMSPDGQVGAVGGVEEKAVAVHNAGATYFIVPDGGGDVDAAKAADQPDLTILPVRSLKQALADLQRIGGVSPTPLTKPRDTDSSA
ncbi:MAG TPA: S16 family serine protease [Acidimicrobiales bacterium]|nr:S16 family serine protease [Acidimicrobiales bacterium]